MTIMGASPSYVLAWYQWHPYELQAMVCGAIAGGILVAHAQKAQLLGHLRDGIARLSLRRSRCPVSREDFDRSHQIVADLVLEAVREERVEHDAEVAALRTQLDEAVRLLRDEHTTYVHDGGTWDGKNCQTCTFLAAFQEDNR